MATNEKRLRRFAEGASFITHADYLKTTFVDELARFISGATVGLYLHDGETDYRAFGALASPCRSSHSSTSAPAFERLPTAACAASDETDVILLSLHMMGSSCCTKK
jgi:hypothetical protein